MLKPEDMEPGLVLMPGRAPNSLHLQPGLGPEPEASNKRPSALAKNTDTPALGLWML